MYPVCHLTADPFDDMGDRVIPSLQDPVEAFKAFSITYCTPLSYVRAQVEYVKPRSSMIYAVSTPMRQTWD